MQTARDFIFLFINNKPYEIRGPKAFMMLADFVRSIGLCGTKIVCAEGDCGACTVICYKKVEANFVPINACIALVAQLDGAHIITVESLKENNQFLPVQQAMIKAHASQCGFCTPGFVMALASLSEEKHELLDEQQVKNHLTGNLCRCTGYESIIKAALEINYSEVKPLASFYVLPESSPKPLHIKNNFQEFYAPFELAQAASWLEENPNALIMNSSTDLGVMINKNKIKIKIKKILSLHRIEELYNINFNNNILEVGACVSLHKLRNFCMKLVPEFARFLNIFASPQIKNMATLIGNVANASPIADTPPFLLVCDAQVYLASKKTTRVVALSELFIAYKKLSLEPGELISHITFKIPKASENLKLYKFSQRRDLDISTVNGALCCEFDKENKNYCLKARIALGGVSATPMRLRQTENVLTNKNFSYELLEQALVTMQQEIMPLDDLRGSASFRRVLVNNMLRSYFENIIGAPHASA